MPELTVVAGANGAGKSTLTKLSSINVPLIDPDALARVISPENPESAALAAGRQAIELARSYIQSGSSFVVETTLAGNTYLNLIREVKALGWSVSLTYVGIDDRENSQPKVINSDFKGIETQQIEVFITGWLIPPNSKQARLITLYIVKRSRLPSTRITLQIDIVTAQTKNPYFHYVLEVEAQPNNFRNL